ncbi:aspartate/glutamate racemase family protein [Sphingopyxis sp. 550A]
MARRIKMIVPVPVPPEALDGFAAQFPAHLLRPDLSVEFCCAARGGTALDSLYEGVMADAFCLDAGLRAEDEGFAAVCVNSMSDSGVAALRSRLSIPVLGTAAPTYHLASQLGRRFSILSMWDRWRWLYDKVLGEAGLSHRLASIRTIGVAPDTAELLSGKEDSVFPKLLDAARAAIEVDGADVLVLGSTTMHQSHLFLQDRLDVPVLNPGLIAFKTCETLLDLGLSHSKRAYQSPRGLNDTAFRFGEALSHPKEEDCLS